MKTTTLESNYKWILPENDVLTDQFNATTHEPHLTAFMKQYIKKGDSVMDIGACFGFHTLTMATCVGLHGHVHAFEPQSDMYSLLHTNVQKNNFDTIVNTYNFALGDIDQSVCMYNAYDGKTNYGDTFISWKYKDLDATEDSNTTDMIGKGGKSLQLQKNLSTCKRLDNIEFPHRISFIKIDVQGFELMVLNGGAKFLKRHRPVMVIELEDQCMNFHGYSSKEVIQHLRQINYKVILLDHSYPCDHVCIPLEQYVAFAKQFTGQIIPHNEDNPINHNIQHGVKFKLVMKQE
jgi:FkbM family methyltransferase